MIDMLRWGLGGEKSREPTPAERRQKREKIAKLIAQESRGDKLKAFTLLAARLHYPLSERHLLAILFSLSERLASRVQDFSIIISDEASGRIPSLIFQEVLNRKRKQLDLSPLMISFLLGGKVNKFQAEAVHDFVTHPPKSLTDDLSRPLIVTEYMHSGDSMKNFLEAFYKNGIQPVVAAVSIDRRIAEYQSLFSKDEDLQSGHKSLEDVLLIGDDAKTSKAYGAAFHGSPDVTGVIRSKSGKSAHPVLLRQAEPTLDKAGAQDKIIQSRDEAALVAEVFARLLKI